MLKAQVSRWTYAGWQEMAVPPDSTHGGRFAHFTKEGKQIVNGCLSPIFRLKRKRQPTEETNQRPWTMTNQCKAKMTEIVQQTQLKAVKETQRVQQPECADDQVHEGEQLN
uniref:Uncharacterized protein n=1 Tax=Knipowitschia caucasica TaxID=637954 RepID=A0AAV2M7N9_KNICA